MADAVEQVVVKFLADNASYMKNLQDSQNALHKYVVFSTNLLEKIEKNTQKTVGATQKQTQATTTLGNTTQKVHTQIQSSSLRMLKNYTDIGAQLGYLIRQYVSLYAIVSSVQNVLSKGIGFNKFMEESTVAFSVMMKDADAAKRKLQELYDFAVASPLTFREVTTGAKQLMAYGFQADELVTSMERLGTVSKAVGTSMEDMVYLYGTLRSQGRAYTRDLTQFAMRGIPIFEELEKTMGKSRAEIQKLTEQGKVGFADIEAAFISMTASGGRFAGMLEAWMSTMQGQMSMLGDMAEQAAGKLTSRLFDDLKLTIRDLIDFMGSSSFDAAIKDLAQTLGLLVETLVTFTKVLIAIRGPLILFAEIFIAGKLAAGLASIISKSSAFITMWKGASLSLANVGGALGLLGASFNPVILGIQTMLILLPALIKYLDSAAQKRVLSIETKTAAGAKTLAEEYSVMATEQQNFGTAIPSILIETLAKKYKMAIQDVADLLVLEKKITAEQAKQIIAEDAYDQKKQERIVNAQKAAGMKGTTTIPIPAQATALAERVQTQIGNIISPEYSKTEKNKLIGWTVLAKEAVDIFYTNLSEEMERQKTFIQRSKGVLTEADLITINQAGMKELEKLYYDLIELGIDFSQSGADEAIIEKYKELGGTIENLKNKQESLNVISQAWQQISDQTSKIIENNYKSAESIFDSMADEETKILKQIAEAQFSGQAAAMANNVKLAESFYFLVDALTAYLNKMKATANQEKQLRALQTRGTLTSLKMDIEGVGVEEADRAAYNYRRSLSEAQAELDVALVQYTEQADRDAALATYALKIKLADAVYKYDMNTFYKDQAEKLKKIQDEADARYAVIDGERRARQEELNAGQYMAFYDDMANYALEYRQLITKNEIDALNLEQKKALDNLAEREDLTFNQLEAEAEMIRKIYAYRIQKTQEEIDLRNANTMLSGDTKFFDKLKVTMMNQLGAGDITGAMGSAAGLAAQGTQVGTMMAGADPIAMMIMELAKFLVSIENVGKVLNFIGTILEGARPILEPLINTILQPLVDILLEMGTVLSQLLVPFLGLLAINMKIFGAVLKITYIPAKLVGKAFQWLYDAVIVPFGNAVIDLINNVIEVVNKLPFVEIAYVEHLETVEEMATKEKRLAAAMGSFESTISYLTDKLQEEVDKQITTYQDLYDLGLINATEYQKKVAEANALLPDQPTDDVPEYFKNLTKLTDISSALITLNGIQTQFKNDSLTDSEKLRILNNAGFNNLKTVSESINTNAASTATNTAVTGQAMADIAWGERAGNKADKIREGRDSFAVGTPFVPYDMTANIHQGEMIVPKTFSDGIRDGTLSLSSPKASDSSVTVVVNVAGSVAVENDLAATIARTIKKQTMRGYV